MKHIKSFNESTNGRFIGNYFLSNDEYNQIWDTVDYVVDEREDFDKYLFVLDNYYNNGGKIQRIVFSNKVDLENIGHHWTHQENNIDNYIQNLYEFLYEEGKVGINPNISLINSFTPAKNISIKYALEQYLTNPWEEEIYIENVNLLSNINISIIK